MFLQSYLESNLKLKILGMFDIENECYEEVKQSLSEIFKQIDELEEITVNEKKFMVEKKMGGDLKFLSILYGINSANSNYPCIWCTCPKSSFGDLSKQYSITDKAKGARKLEEARKILAKTPRERMKPAEHLGYQNLPLTNIEFDCCVIDVLHMFLRIAETLLKLFLSDIFLADETDTNDLEKRPHLKRFVIFLKEINIYNPIYTKERKFEFRTFRGDELLRIFSIANLETLFPGMRNISYISSIWSQFYNLIMEIRNNQTDSIEERLFEWLALFLLTYMPNHITPYIHSFVFHIPEFIKLHGDVNLFNLQGLEKLNDISTQNYHRSSNKKNDNKQYIKQMIEKRNRLEYFNS